MEPEVLNLATLGGSGALGYLFRYLAESRRQSHQERLALLDQQRQDRQQAMDSADRAANRGADFGGTWTRRFIVFSIACALIYFLYFLAFSDTPIVVEVIKEKRGLLGLGPLRQVTEFVTAQGFVILHELRLAFLAIIGFYFGQGVK